MFYTQSAITVGNSKVHNFNFISRSVTPGLGRKSDLGNDTDMLTFFLMTYVLNFDLLSIICECIRLNSTTVHDCGVSNATVCIGHDKHISIGIGCMVCFFPPLLPL